MINMQMYVQHGGGLPPATCRVGSNVACKRNMPCSHSLPLHPLLSVRITLCAVYTALLMIMQVHYNLQRC